MFNKCEKSFDSCNGLRHIGRGESLSRRCFCLVGISKRQVFAYCLLIGLSLPLGEVNAQGMEINRDGWKVSTSTFKLAEFLPEKQFNGIRNGVEVLSSVSGELKLMSSPHSETERNNRPSQVQEGDIGFDVGGKLNNGIEHDNWLPWMLILNFFCLIFGVSFSFHISPKILEKRRRWMRYHDLKARRFYRQHPDKYYPMPRKTFWQWVWF